jgi:hypothetical protein
MVACWCCALHQLREVVAGLEELLILAGASWMHCFIFFLQWIEMSGFWGERVAYIYYDGEELKEQ